MPVEQGFISFDIWTALFILLNTVTMFLVLKRYLFQPVLKMIKDRQDEIDNMYDEADKAKASADALQAEYQQKLNQAADTSERIVKEAMARGQSREEEIIRQANAEAAAIMDKAAADIAQEKKKAINDAKDEISGMAMAIAEKVVGRELKAEDQDKLFDEFISELGEGL
ncbi:MAG: F0F1 ATP synthase subunit B [Oscillospiraceae bacterium]|nr:F0F1 ATP synthase subunit B [Oscillospiraceae bacterium]